ncbi:MAG: hypothetical protein WCJ56_12025 [bacterium]
MPIPFSSDRWEKIRADYNDWWAGKLTRPLIYMPVWGRDPGREKPKLPRVSMDTTAFDLSVSAADMLNRWDYELCGKEYLGDSFPYLWPDFGPGVIAAFLGATPNTGAGTVWFHPPQQQEIADIHFSYAPDNIWYQRIKDIYRAGLERWNGNVLLGATDIGGNLDILHSFRPGNELLYDLIDYPEEVKRLTWDAHHLWWQYYDEFKQLLQPVNPGYSAWASIFSADPYYMLQCDFAYMLSPEMFDEFVRPELNASCDRLTNAFYHLDGIGQLPHLDSLLRIESLKGIQWIPGAGQPDYTHWPQVYRKIRNAGKLIQLYGDIGTLDAVAEQLGSAEGIILLTGCDMAHRTDAEDALRRYGAL